MIGIKINERVFQLAKTELFGVLEGVNNGKEFRRELKFKLIPPDEGTKHYGTGYYMTVVIDNDTDNERYVDVRYEKTTDIEVLANQWVNGYYGDNLKKFDTFTVEYDSIGGAHSGGIGYAPDGEYCGECTSATCENCKIWASKQSSK